jgi:hypothetical protein
MYHGLLGPTRLYVANIEASYAFGIFEQLKINSIHPSFNPALGDIRYFRQHKRLPIFLWILLQIWEALLESL